MSVTSNIFCQWYVLVLMYSAGICYIHQISVLRAFACFVLNSGLNTLWYSIIVVNPHTQINVFNILVVSRSVSD